MKRQVDWGRRWLSQLPGKQAQINLHLLPPCVAHRGSLLPQMEI